MSVDKIRDLLVLMREYDIVELELEEGDFSVALRKQGAFAPPQAAAPAQAAPLPAPAAASASPAAAPDPPPTVGDASLSQVKSPIVGTFYRGPSPEAAPFVDVGTKVTGDSVVCIIEAMKIMNEIKAEMDGVIAKVLVESGEPVEYGQPLFLIRSAGA
ncbi:MAG: acetyl-CoA carboxylase biotin carboxyl carrier protein [Planctomycetota bacterium]|jgi:acetyl-CoA carboxylase biotin carboxyl carrier protein|nr:acetyl-CoA carboxylase biotin carboxyl carrier protein [Planctomycetota bacterium]